MHTCFIVPANIFQNIAEKGSEKQKGFARRILGFLTSFGKEREEFLHSLSREVKQGLVGLSADEIKINRRIHDAEHKMQLPGKIVREEGKKETKDASVNKAYDYLGLTHELFRKFFERNSIDDKGMRLDGVVNFGRNFGNAFWDGSHMVFGNGDGEIFQSFLIDDVVGHELSHGITEHTAGLEYRYMSGALNESFSDIFGSMVKQFARNQKATESDWMIGEGLFTENVNARCLRDMKNPGTAYDDPILGKDPQPDHMSKYVKTDADAGGVHINSSIQNKFFCELAISLGGYSWEKAGKIMYATLCEELTSTSQFQDAANATFKVAGKLYGHNSTEQKATREAWRVVGLEPKETKSHHKKVLEMGFNTFTGV